LNSPLELYTTELGGKTGISPYKIKVERRLSDLLDYFSDREASEEILRGGEDPIIYEVYEIPFEPLEGLLNVGCTVIYPGKVGDEYYFTKGHFHEKESTSEIYIGMKGEGIILIQDHEGKAVNIKIKPNVLVYIPPGTAHRTVNVGREKLVFIAIYPSDAGHDYETVRTKGFARVVLEEDGKPIIKDNPRYKRE